KRETDHACESRAGCRKPRNRDQRGQPALSPAQLRWNRAQGSDGGCRPDTRRFYKQFTSKEDLAAQASKRALESASNRWSAAAAANPKDPLSAVVAIFLSTDHREERMDGCPIVALGSDAARQGSDVKASFEAGIREYL